MPVILILALLFTQQSFAKSFPEVLSIISSGDYDRGARELEDMIRVEKNKAMRGNFAALLAQFPKTTKLNKKRHVYAAMAVENAPELSDEEMVKLCRIAGDGFFEQAKLKVAIKYYRKALDQSLVSGKEISYINYKLAFVYVNLEKYKNAIKYLSKAYQEDRDGSFREAIASDMGKIWAESQYYKELVSVDHLNQFKSNYDREGELTKGIFISVKKFFKKGPLPVFRPLSAGSQVLFSSLMKLIFEEKFHSSFEACDIIPWIVKANHKVEKSVLTPILNSCSKQLVKTKKKEKDSKLLEHIADLYAQQEVTGKDRWAYTQVLEKQGKSEKACEQMIKQTNEDIKAPYKDFFGNLGQVKRICQGTIQVADSSDLDQLLDKILKEPGLLSPKQAKRDDIIEFLGRPFAKEKSLKKIEDLGKKLDRSFVFRFLATTKDIDDEYKYKLLEKSGKIPLEGVELKLFLSMKPNLDKLKEFLPYKKLNSFEQMIPWIQLAESGKADVDKSEIFKKALGTLPKGGKERNSAMKKISLLLLKEKNISSFLSVWPQVHGLMKSDNQMINLVASLCFEEKACKAGDWEDLKPKNQVSQFFAESLAFLEGSEKKIPTPPPALKRHKLSVDFGLIKKEQKNQGKIQSSVSSLDKNIEQKIMALKGSIDRYTGRQWYSQNIRGQMFELLNSRVSLFSEKLQDLANKNKSNPQYAELAQVVESWKIKQ